jgi:hypothetical protein
MNKHETFREYFRRARTDPSVRAHLLENARYSRSVFGWLLLVFGILAVCQFGFQLWTEGVWISRSSLFSIFSFAATWLIHNKFGDRIAVLAALDDAGEPTPTRIAPPAGRDLR